MLIVGPPGAGKGTQASAVAEAYGIPAISTGDIFRANIEQGSDLGKQVQEVMASGGFVPDELTNSIVADRLKQDDAQGGFLLDGYPRTTEQVHELDRILAESGAELDAVIQLQADTDEVVKRLTKRALEQGRVDDTEDVIRHRQDLYREQTEPVIAIYAERGVVVEVDGLGTVDDVAARVRDGLAARGLGVHA